MHWRVRCSFRDFVSKCNLIVVSVVAIYRLTIDANDYYCTNTNKTNSNNNIAAVTAAREKAASFWLSWALDQSHAHRPGAPINSQYVYDTKYKQNSYGALLDVYCINYGQSEGELLAAADSGPLDEAYVGGGS